MDKVVKVYVPYIRFVSPTKVLIGKNWYNAVRCDVRKLPERIPYNKQQGEVLLPEYVAREI